jgi:hypothetical protein
MSARTASRPLALAVLLVAGWLVVAASAASARLAPEPPQILAPSGAPVLASATVEGAPMLQYLLVAAAACLVTLVVTLGSQAVLHRRQRHHGVVATA